jgi:hypothetical protein
MCSFVAAERTPLCCRLVAACLSALVVARGAVAPSPCSGLGGKVEDLGGGEEMITWRGGTHELGRGIRKLPKQIVF